MNDNEYIKMKQDMTELKHYGTPRHSGRYPWGSGDNPYQSSNDFISRVDDLKKSGMSDGDIAREFGMTHTDFRDNLSLAKNTREAAIIDKIYRLREQGMSNPQIAKELGLAGESTVRSKLNSDIKARVNSAQTTADYIKNVIDDKGIVDIGGGTHLELGISPHRMNQAVEMLKAQGYEEYIGNVPQANNPGKYTRLKVLAKPGTEYKEIYDYENVGSLTDYISTDGGDTFTKAFEYPASFDSKRLAVRYAEDGGAMKDGVVELRRGVDDISLGGSNYSQVRILVDGDRYIKGMAVYSDDMPDGIDMIFNTNKSNVVPKLDTLKKITDDPDNPFGSNIKEVGGQSYYLDANGKKQLSVINKRADEGDWGEWSRELSSQFLSKQSQKMIDTQLDLSLSNKLSEYEDIMNLTNPTLKKSFLESFADDMDAAAVHLKAASLPGQTYKVILPVNSLKDSEIYAPHLADGSEVTLVRYPHGGTFEIPRLTVNNRNKEGINILTSIPSDAVGINHRVAELMSGADFDGDTVMVIPSNKKLKVTNKKPLEDLKGFDPKLEYGGEVKIVDGKERYFRGDREFKPMSDALTQKQMGIISNLITDMTLKDATDSELARAVKHSMVVIDAAKHGLDYKQSEHDNGIKALHKKYQLHEKQPGVFGQGASTLISKAKSEVDVLDRKEGAFFKKGTTTELVAIEPKNNNTKYLDPDTGKTYSKKDVRTLYTHPETGAKLYRDTGETYTRVEYKNNKGKKISAPTIVKDNMLYYKDETGGYSPVSTQTVITKDVINKSTLMAETKDAHRLSSGTEQEKSYANYANEVKKLANQARLDAYHIVEQGYNKSTRGVYDDEKKSLEHKINEALLNTPRERRAQMIAASSIKAKKKDNPNMTDEQEKKLKDREIKQARAKVGAVRKEVKITGREWEAIQAGAMSSSKLKLLFRNADLKTLREYAMPKESNTLSTNKVRRLKNLASSGYTTAEISEALGISPSSVTKYLKGE